MKELLTIVSALFVYDVLQNIFYSLLDLLDNWLAELQRRIRTRMAAERK